MPVIQYHIELDEPTVEQAQSTLLGRTVIDPDQRSAQPPRLEVYVCCSGLSGPGDSTGDGKVRFRTSDRTGPYFGRGLTRTGAAPPHSESLNLPTVPSIRLLNYLTSNPAFKCHCHFDWCWLAFWSRVLIRRLDLWPVSYGFVTCYTSRIRILLTNTQGPNFWLASQFPTRIRSYTYICQHAFGVRSITFVNFLFCFETFSGGWVSQVVPA